MLAPSCRAVFQYLLVDSGSPAKKTKSMPTKDSESIFWMMEGSSPAVVICPAASSASSNSTSQAASGDSGSASLSSLPTSEAAPTMPIRYGLPAITPTPDSLPISLPHSGQSPPQIHEPPNAYAGPGSRERRRLRPQEYARRASTPELRYPSAMIINIHSDFHAINAPIDRKSTRLNSSHLGISYAVFCLKKK